MRELTEWWHQINGTECRWLILGKGPSFERRNDYNLHSYTTIAINHVVRELRVDVTSAVNYDVLRDCGDAIYENSRFLLMPRYPHSIPGDAEFLLESYFQTYPVLEQLNREERLIWYNLSSDPFFPGAPVIENSAFSVCILFNLLATLGVCRLRTLGVDGGRAYASSFADIEEKTRLANGMATYDNQFPDMMRTVRRYGLDYAPLNDRDQRLRLKMLWHFRRQGFKFYPRRFFRCWLSRLPRRGWLTSL